MPSFQVPHYFSHYPIAAILVLLLATGCQTAPPIARESAVLSEQSVSTPVPTHAETFDVLPAESEIRLLVYRAGALANFGHNHVITAPVEGKLYRTDNFHASGFRLRIPVNALDVDPPAARAEEGENFAGTLSDEAHKATRENMLGESQLHAEEHPYIVIESIKLSGPRWNPDVRARVSIRGIARTVQFPAAVFEDGNRLVIIANFTVAHSDFGIEPYSAFGGGLKVRNAIDIRIRIVARGMP